MAEGQGTIASCAGCVAGSFCPQNSSALRPCGNSSVFCAVNSSEPMAVGLGNYSSPSVNAVEERVCEPGSYCVSGVKVPCPGGTYSSQVGGVVVLVVGC